MPEVSPRGAWRPGLALLVAATFFMENLDGTVLTTAVPSIAADFRVAPSEVSITMTAYLVTVAVFIALSGWLAERFGARRIFCLAIAVFTVASLLCALSPDLQLLTLSRILQGLGGAMMVPVGSLVVLRETPKADLLGAIAYLTWPGLVAPVLAPLVGGFFTTYLSWHWIFLVNIPLGLTAFVVALRLVRIGPGAAKHRLDWVGMAGTTFGIAALVIGLELASGSSPVALPAASLAAGLLALAGAASWMRRARNPLFDLRVFRVRTFRAMATGGFVYRLTVSSVPFLLPLMLQDGFGWGPLQSGLMVAAVFIGNLGVKPATTPLIRRFGFKPVLVFAAAGSAATFVLCAMLSAATLQPLIFALLVCSGAFRSIGFSAYNSVQYADIEASQLPSANSLSATLSQLGTGMGIAIAALSLRVVGTAAGRGDQLLQYRGAFLVMAVLMLLSAADSLRLPTGTAAHVSGTGGTGRSPGRAGNAAGHAAGAGPAKSAGAVRKRA
ncbi:MAG: MFS transporter [Actinomycetota bacterium]|nr:MFS transporter [Actinomycetota bacterium]